MPFSNNPESAVFHGLARGYLHDDVAFHEMLSFLIGDCYQRLHMRMYKQEDIGV